MADMEKDLLKGLEAELKETEGIGETSIFTSKELDAPMDILRAEVTEFGSDLVSVLGEFFFLPIEEDDIRYFSIAITISGSVEKAALADAGAAIARLNYFLPFGCFCLGGEENSLVFRHTVLLDTTVKKDIQAKEIALASNAAISVAERFSEYLLLIIRNEMSIKEMLKIFK